MALEDERRELDAVVARLAERFPDAPTTEIRAAVDRELATFDEAHVRDFVPVLVESSASETLRERYDSQVPTAPDDPGDMPAQEGPLNSA